MPHPADLFGVHQQLGVREGDGISEGAGRLCRPARAIQHRALRHFDSKGQRGGGLPVPVEAGHRGVIGDEDRDLAAIGRGNGRAPHRLPHVGNGSPEAVAQGAAIFQRRQDGVHLLSTAGRAVQQDVAGGDFRLDAGAGRRQEGIGPGLGVAAGDLLRLKGTPNETLLCLNGGQVEVVNKQLVVRQPPGLEVV